MDELDDDEITPIDWENKYKQLKKNFDALDRHNDVLYRVYVAGRRLRNAKGTFSDYLIEDFSKLYALGAVVSFPIFTVSGGLVGLQLVAFNKNYDKHPIGNILTILGGCTIGGVASLVYPAVYIIAPLKFIYDLV